MMVRSSARVGFCLGTTFGVVAPVGRPVALRPCGWAGGAGAVGGLHALGFRPVGAGADIATPGCRHPRLAGSPIVRMEVARDGGLTAASAALSQVAARAGRVLLPLQRRVGVVVDGGRGRGRSGATARPASRGIKAEPLLSPPPPVRQATPAAPSEAHSTPAPPLPPLGNDDVRTPLSLFGIEDAPGPLPLSKVEDAPAPTYAELPPLIPHTAAPVLRAIVDGRLVPLPATVLPSPRPRSAVVYADPDSSAVVAIYVRKTDMDGRDAQGALRLLKAVAPDAAVRVVAVTGGGRCSAGGTRALADAGVAVLADDGLRWAAATSAETASATVATAEAADPAVSLSPLSSAAIERATKITVFLRHLLARDEADRAGHSADVLSRHIASLEQSNTATAADGDADRLLLERSRFSLEAPYPPRGDQPAAIRALTAGLQADPPRRFQTLRGCTGTGKTFVMANIIARTDKPTLVLAPNKTLAAQLCNELRAYLPRNRVEYFVSFYNHYCPEAYLPASDTHIAKSSSINDDIDRFRHAATRALLERPDTVIVASVSCIYGLGMPSTYLEAAIRAIKDEAKACVAAFAAAGKRLEADRLRERVAADVAMLAEVGYCQGVENYSRHLSGRAPGAPSECLLDYFPADDWLLIVDESHVTVPQVSSMAVGDRVRKDALIAHGFRLPSAYDNRALTGAEFWAKVSRAVLVSATPGDFELQAASSAGGEVVDQVIRPTGVLDPVVHIFPSAGQVDHLAAALVARAARGERAIVTTLTKKMAEDLSTHLAERPPVAGVLGRPLSVSFLHSGVDSVARMEVLEQIKRPVVVPADAANGTEADGIDVVVGVNLLREGIDVPGVSLVAIMDADKDGFLRSDTALIQTIGRAARNVRGEVFMYADMVTSSMRSAINETNRRRAIQVAYNTERGVSPTPLVAKTLPAGGRRGAAQGGAKQLLHEVREHHAERSPRRVTDVASSDGLGDDAVATGGAWPLAPLANDDDAAAAVDALGDGSDGPARVETLRTRMKAAARRLDFEAAAAMQAQIAALDGAPAGAAPRQGGIASARHAVPPAA
ncbi:hypothetical protein I4F81_001240 [Pyropia yezoensis]|uniref:Uncharacterized protein n=1 Tax=Pyropia yezoensis TaxID=2788 RepID=A0ACC3BLN5_PYRYE|nr:hypothetical protein I4F81_001240 [Neopyropia yezoensis]